MLENSKVATELPWQYTCADVSIAPTGKNGLCSYQLESRMSTSQEELHR